MADGTKIGEGYIEITPELELRLLKKATNEVRDELKRMGRAASSEWQKQNADLMGEQTKQFKALHKGQAQGVFAAHRAEIRSSQQLERQRQSAMQQTTREAAARGKAQIDAIRRNISAQVALERQKQRELAAIAKAQFEFDKAHHKALIENQRRDEARAPGGPLNVGRGLDRISDTLGQLSTRVGIAAFQMQMLGVMLHQTITAPALQGFVQLSTVGLQFAVNIDYARASMQALLGPTADVEQILNDIKQITIESPLFAADDAIKYAQQLAAVGVKGRDLVPTMDAMSNIFLTQGVAGPERATLAMLAYTQILSKGAIGMDDLRQQFAEHVPGGIKIFEEVARRLGYKSIKALSTAMKDGEVSAAQLNKEFIEFGNTQKFLEGGAKAAQTLGGVWQSLKEEVVTRVGSAFDANRHAIIRAINSIRPVVMALIDWFVKSIPRVIYALQELIDRIRDWKAAYDALTPAQQENVRLLGLLLLAAGPASVALGILGTALSTVANASSLLVKILGLAAGGSGIGVVGVAAITVSAAIVGLAAAMAYAYNQSEPFRKAFLQIANVLKDLFASTVLPLMDYIWMRLQQLGKLFESIGIETKHFAYLLYLLVIPLVAMLIPLLQIALVLEAARFAFVGIYGAIDLATEALAGFFWILQQVMQGLSHLPGNLGKDFESAAEAMQGVSKGLHEYFNTPAKFRVATTDTDVDKNRYDGLAEQLKDLDLTTTGLTGAFDGWGTSLDGVTQKEITLEQAINNARRAMDAQNASAASSVSANDAYKRSKISLTEAVERNKKTLSDNTAAGLSNREALRLATTASYELMLQQIKSGVPYAQAIANHKARTNALVGEFGKAKAVRTEAQKLVETYGKVPKDVKTLLQMMGYKDVNAKMIDLLAKQRVAKNPTVQYSEAKHAIEKQSRLASGGMVRGPGGPTADKVPALLSNREYVVRASSVRNLGTGVLDYINQHGQLPAQFAGGGSVQWPYQYDVSKTQIPGWMGGAANGGGIGTTRMMQILRGAFPGLAMISGHRPGAITSTGNQSYHALNRAVDLPPRWDVFNWIREHYGRSTKELIFTPAGGLQIKNGKDHVYTGGTIQKDHFDHVHWAYDNGGYIPPGQTFVNNSNTSELALNAAQGRALEERIRNSDRPVNVAVYVDGVRRDAELVWEEKADELSRMLGGAV